jgi:ABC-type Zn uptake system ZnuABC Zn-binding protein ZnuA
MTVCIDMEPQDQNPQWSSVGDPLLEFAPAEYPPEQRSSRTSDRRPPRRKEKSRPLNSVTTARTGGIRLSLCVAAVFASTVVLAQQGDESSSVVASSPANTNATTDAPIVPQKRVLVSDPANTAIVREIAGDLLIVESIIPPGANGHTYEPVPGDAIKAASADLYIENGMELNTAVTNFVRANYRSGTPELSLADAIPKNEVISTDTAEQIAAHGHAHSYNAHFWTNPEYAIMYAQQITAALSRIDAANSDTYAMRANTFIERLRVLDDAFEVAIASIPAQNKKLVVYHDSWSYFGRRYGIPVVGAIQPVSFSEPSANEIRKIIDQIRREAVPAFFGSEVFPSDVLNAISAETESKYYSDLSDEVLPGTPGSPEHSYEGMMIQNVRLMTIALGGNVSLLDNLTPGGSPS